MYVPCDQFSCFCPYWREANFMSTLTAQAQNAVPRIFALPTNTQMHFLIYDYY